MKQQHITSLLNILLLLLFSVNNLYARLGGAGGGSGGGSGGGGGGGYTGGGGSIGSGSNSGGNSGDIGLVDSIIGFVLLAFMLYIMLFVVPKIKRFIQKRFSEGKDAVNNSYLQMRFVKNVKGLGWNFDLKEFNEKVETSFIKLQNAWSNKRLSPIRQFISDGMYRRLKVQIDLMNLLKQRNEISDIKIISITPLEAEKDGNLDTITVKIKASMKDRFISEKKPELNSTSRDEFVEYWTYVKMHGSVSTSNLFESTKCPSCGAPYPEEMGEAAVCEYCKTVLNTGEYDWVLAEITQEDAWKETTVIRENFKTYSHWNTVQEIMPDISHQYLEDVASNAFLQIIAAKQLENIDYVKYFCTARGFQSLDKIVIVSEIDKVKRQNGFSSIEQHKKWLATKEEDREAPKLELGEPFIERLFINDATVVNTVIDDQCVLCTVGISYCISVLIQFEDGTSHTINTNMVKSSIGITLKKRINNLKPKVQLLVHRCPSCGAPMQEKTSYNCSSCGEAFNSAERDWVVDEVLSTNEIQKYVSKFEKIDKFGDL